MDATRRRAREHAAVPPLPERVPKHALDLLAGVGTGEMPDGSCRTRGARSRSMRMTASGRRGPPAVAPVRLSRRRQPRRPDGRRGRPADARSRPARRSPCDGLRVAPASRRVPHRLQGRLLPRRAVVPEDRRPRRTTGGTATSTTPPASSSPTSATTTSRSTCPRAYRGKVGATGLPHRRARDLGRPGALALPADGVHDFAWTADPTYLVYDDMFREPGIGDVRFILLLQPEHAAQA